MTLLILLTHVCFPESDVIHKHPISNPSTMKKGLEQYKILIIYTATSRLPVVYLQGFPYIFLLKLME